MPDLASIRASHKVAVDAGSLLWRLSQVLVMVDGATPASSEVDLVLLHSLFEDVLLLQLLPAHLLLIKNTG